MTYRRYRSDTIAKGVSSPDRIKGLKVPTGFMLETTHFVGGIAAEENRVGELGYVDITGNDKILRVHKPDTMMSMEITGSVWLEEGEYPYVSLINLDTNSEYFLSVHGKLWPKDCVGVIIAKVQP